MQSYCFFFEKGNFGGVILPLQKDILCSEPFVRGNVMPRMQNGCVGTLGNVCLFFVPQFHGSTRNRNSFLINFLFIFPPSIFTIFSGTVELIIIINIIIG